MLQGLMKWLGGDLQRGSAREPKKTQSKQPQALQDGKLGLNTKAEFMRPNPEP